MASSPTALIAFDIIADGDSLIGETWDERRAHLERVLKAAPKSLQHVLRPSDVAYGSPAAMLREASRRGWEGIMAKRRECPYEPGRRVKHWQKLKLENEQEFVVGGFTAPRNSPSLAPSICCVMRARIAMRSSRSLSPRPIRRIRTAW